MGALLGPKNRGSLSFAVIASITALSIGSFYVAQTTRQTQQAVNEAMSERIKELGQSSNLSNLALLRSLMSESLTPDKVTHEPALFPIDYFAKTWSLQKNSKFVLKNVETNNSQITVRSFAPGEATVEAVAPIFNQTMDQLSSLKDAQNLEVVALNPHPNYPFYIESVDVKAKRVVNLQDSKIREKDIVTYGRINLPAPVPQEMSLKIRGEHDSTFGDNFGSQKKPLPPGKYIIQLSGRGVIHHGEIIANGDKTLVGLDNQGNIVHKANSIHSESIIGETRPLDLNGGEGTEIEHVKKEGCDLDVLNELTPGSAPGSINIIAKLIGVDGSEAAKLTISKQVIVGRVIPSLSAHAGAPVCQNFCPANAANEVYTNHENFANNLDRALTPGRYGNDTFEAEKTGEVNTQRGRGIVCSNYELTAQEIKNKMGMDPSRARATNPTLYAKVLWKALKLKQFVSYMAPACQREVVGLRNGCGCFASDTLILMADGSSKIASDIRSGDLVWNPKTSKAQMIKKVIAGPEQWPLIEVKSDGKAVVVTGEHPFLTKTGLKPAFQLTATDILLDGDKETAIESVTTQVRAEGEAAPEVWNFELVGSSANDDHYVLANGVMTGDLYLQNKLSGKLTSRQIVNE